MVVTHLLQILAFVAMEPPTALAPMPITEEKNKVFRSLRPLDPDRVVRGQYEGYRAEPGVAPDSQTETFVALRCEIDNWRWSGVPFYLRTGKRMARRRADHLDRLPRAAAEHVPRPTRGSAATAPTTSPSTSTSPRASRSPSTASGPGPGMVLGQAEHAVLARRNRLPAATRSRPTSG